MEGRMRRGGAAPRAGALLQTGAGLGRVPIVACFPKPKRLPGSAPLWYWDKAIPTDLA